MRGEECAIRPPTRIECEIETLDQGAYPHSLIAGLVNQS
jgi:hypothetical protein